MGGGTGFTPYFLMFAVEARIPSEILVDLPQMERTPAGYAYERYQKHGVAYEAALESAYTAAKRAKMYYDIGAIQMQFQVADNVRICMAQVNRPSPQNCIPPSLKFTDSWQGMEYLLQWRTLRRRNPLAFT